MTIINKIAYGFKGTIKGYCRGFKFEIGKTYKKENKPIVCKFGFHFCEKLDDIDKYYSFDIKDIEIYLVKAGPQIDRKDDKICTNKIKILRKIKPNEFNKLSEKFFMNSKNKIFDKLNSTKFFMDFLVAEKKPKLKLRSKI